MIKLICKKRFLRCIISIETIILLNLQMFFKNIHTLLKLLQHPNNNKGYDFQICDYS